jgi:hypothetical protein
LRLEIAYSSDSTSHKHIEYESRTIAIRVVDYTMPDAEPTWKLRTLGINTSTNHASQTQVNGLRKRLTEIADVFNNSPLAKREGSDVMAWLGLETMALAWLFMALA